MYVNLTMNIGVRLHKVGTPLPRKELIHDP